MRNNNIRIFGAGYWREGRDKYEQKIIVYTEAPKPIAQAITIADFLPLPEELNRKRKKDEKPVDSISAGWFMDRRR